MTCRAAFGGADEGVRTCAFLVRLNSRHSYQSSGYGLIGAEAEQQIWMAGGAQRGRLDIPGRYAGIHQLPPVRFYQVEEEFHWQLAVSRSARCQKQQGVLLADRVGFFHLAKKLWRVGELSLKFAAYFFPNLVAATVYAGADGGDQIPRPAPKVPLHLADAFFHDSFHRATPARVEYAHGPPLPVHHDHRETVGGLHRQQQPWDIGDQSVPDRSLLRHALDTADQVRVNLSKCNEGPAFTRVSNPQFLEKELAVALNRCAGVVLCESKIQRISTIDTRHPSAPSGECMHQPGKPDQIVGLQKL